MKETTSRTNYSDMVGLAVAMMFFALARIITPQFLAAYREFGLALPTITRCGFNIVFQGLVLVAPTSIFAYCLARRKKSTFIARLRIVGYVILSLSIIYYVMIWFPPTMLRMVE